jgi:hypothetical protein
MRTAARPMTLAKAAGRYPRIIDKLVNERMQVDWSIDPGDYKYKQYQAEKGDAFNDLLQWALRELKEVNEDIKDVRKAALQNLRKFERSALPALEAEGFIVKLGKFEFRDHVHYVTYDGGQDVVISGPPTHRAVTKRFSFTLRDDLYVAVKNGPHHYASRHPGLTFVDLVKAAMQYW